MPFPLALVCSALRLLRPHVFNIKPAIPVPAAHAEGAGQPEWQQPAAPPAELSARISHIKQEAIRLLVREHAFVHAWRARMGVLSPPAAVRAWCMCLIPHSALFATFSGMNARGQGRLPCIFCSLWSGVFVPCCLHAGSRWPPLPLALCSGPLCETCAPDVASYAPSLPFSPHPTAPDRPHCLLCPIASS